METKGAQEDIQEHSFRSGLRASRRKLKAQNTIGRCLSAVRADDSEISTNIRAVDDVHMSLLST